jgi:hypothetical protein
MHLVLDKSAITRYVEVIAKAVECFLDTLVANRMG